MDIVKAENLKYEYIQVDEEGNEESRSIAVDGVSLDIKAGDFVAILGHNGSGKSTLAKHINAILLPTEGSLYVDGKDTRDESKLWEIRQTAGMVFQNPDNQIIGTIVEEDVGFGPENMGVPQAEIWKRVEQSLKSVGMWEYRTHSPNKLSGGQKQRVAIAGMLAMNPQCIIFDESTAMLDPQGRKDIMQTILTLIDRGITVVLITHYMNEAAMADNIILVDHGKVILSGTPDEVFLQSDLLSEHGLEAPQAAALVQSLKKSGVDIRVKGVLDANDAANAIIEALKKSGKYTGVQNNA